MRRISLLVFLSLLFLQSCTYPTGVTAVVDQIPDLPKPTMRTPEPSATAEELIDTDTAALNGVEVSLWHGLDGQSSTLIDQMVGEFNLTNPYGIKVIASPQGNFAKLGEGIDGLGSASETPDMLIALPEQIIADSENLVDLSPYMASKEIGLAGVEIPAPLLAQSNVEGQQFGLPMTRSARFLFYNQTFAREIGFDHAPVTLAEFEEQVCAANASWKTDDDLTNDGYGGFALDTFSNWQTPLSWIVSNDEQFGKSSPLVFETPEITKVFTFFENLRTSSCAWFADSEQNYQNLARRRALAVTGDLLEINSQRDAFTNEKSEDVWAVIPFPGKTTSIVIYGVDYAIIQKAPEKQLASWMFLRSMMQSENQMRWAVDTKLFPVTASALDLAATSSAFPKQYQQAVGLVANSYGYPQNPGWAMIKNLLADGTYQFNKMYPYITAADLLKSIDSQAADIIK